MQSGSELNKYQNRIEDLRSLFWSIQTSEAMMEAVVKHVIPDGMRHTPLRQLTWFNDRSVNMHNIGRRKCNSRTGYHDIVF